MAVQTSGAAEEDISIDVPMSEKDQAKRLGAKPLYRDKKFISWYIPRGKNVEPFAQWLPCDPNESSMTLSQLLSEVKRVISSGMSGRYWITAEILQVSATRHIYLELTDTDDAGSEKAKARASIWASKKHIIDEFERETGQSLCAGTRVMLQVEVDYHERFGLGLVVQAIDPRFTVGEMALRVAKIRESLMAAGLYGLNKSLDAPRDFNKVIVLSPEQAAGLGDFRTVADHLQASGICEFNYVHRAFQGDGAMDVLSNIISQISDQVRESPGEYDAIVIIRGGGDKAGLYQLNHLPLAQALCKAPLPVLVGIGHERDETILNEIANQAFATPSMVAQQIAGTIAYNVQAARESSLKLRKASERLLSFAKQIVKEEYVGLREGSRENLADARLICEMSEKEMQSSAKAMILRAKNNCKELMSMILYQDPSKIIGRGYLVAKDKDNCVVSDQASIKSGEVLSLVFRDGNRNVAAE